MNAIKRIAKTATDGRVLRLALPAYLLPGAGIAAQIVGFGALGATWPWLLGASAGLHALLALNQASRPEESDEAISEGTRRGRQLSSLEAGFARLNAPDGVKAARELIHEYEQLQPVLARRKMTDSLAIGQIPALADETYKQGLSVLQDALDLLEASGPEDRARLEEENEALAKEAKAMQGDPSQAARAKVRQERVASNKELLDVMNQQQARIDELLYQSDRCGTSLHRTRMELAALRAEGSEEGVNAVVDTLRLTISHAKGVQEELRKLGTQPSA